MGGESREGWIPFIRRQQDDLTNTLPSVAPPAPPSTLHMWDVADPRNSGSEMKPVSDVLWEGAKVAGHDLINPKVLRS